MLFSYRVTRLLGPNIYFKGVGALLNVSVSTGQEQLIELFSTEAKRVLDLIGWGNSTVVHRKYSNGVCFAMTAPVDLLMVACDVLELILQSVDLLNTSNLPISSDEICETLLVKIQENTNLNYRNVYAIAQKHHLNVFLSDNNTTISIGSGKNVYTVNSTDLNAVNLIPWQEIKSIPVALITGTNGKTTTVRLVNFIAKMAGDNPGYCSTHEVVVGDSILDEGDLSGPTGCQMVLTNKMVNVAILEVARGGLARRGLVANFVNVATITNLNVDHLGIDGVDSIADMAQVKALVYDTLAPDGYAVINLDDNELKNKSRTIKNKKIFISQKLSLIEMMPMLADHDSAIYIKDSAIYWVNHNQEPKYITDLQSIPITFSGAAIHNVENVLHAIAISHSLGYTLEHVAVALGQYDAKTNNQGRANVFDINGGKIIVDYGHNLNAIELMLNLAKSFLNKNNSSRFVVLFGITGDRIAMIDNIAKLVIENNVDEVLLKDLSLYLRGVDKGLIPLELKNKLLDKGMAERQLKVVNGEVAAVNYALENIKSDDVYLLFCHEEITDVLEHIKLRIN